MHSVKSAGARRRRMTSTSRKLPQRETRKIKLYPAAAAEPGPERSHGRVTGGVGDDVSV